MDIKKHYYQPLTDAWKLFKSYLDLCEKDHNVINTEAFWTNWLNDCGKLLDVHKGSKFLSEQLALFSEQLEKLARIKEVA